MQKKIETEMINDFKQLGAKEIMVKEFNRSGDVVRSKIYVKPLFAIRKLINFAQGYFPMYQNSRVTNNGYAIEISFN